MIHYWNNISLSNLAKWLYNSWQYFFYWFMSHDYMKWLRLHPTTLFFRFRTGLCIVFLFTFSTVVAWILFFGGFLQHIMFFLSTYVMEVLLSYVTKTLRKSECFAFPADLMQCLLFYSFWLFLFLIIQLANVANLVGQLN